VRRCRYGDLDCLRKLFVLDKWRCLCTGLLLPRSTLFRWGRLGSSRPQDARGRSSWQAICRPCSGRRVPQCYWAEWSLKFCQSEECDHPWSSTCPFGAGQAIARCSWWSFGWGLFPLPTRDCCPQTSHSSFWNSRRKDVACKWAAKFLTGALRTCHWAHRWFL